MSTFVQMQTELQAVGPFDTTTASANRLKLWLNDAQNWWLAARRWSYLEASQTVASVSGQADYVLLGTSPVLTDYDTLIDVSHNQANAGTTFVKLRFMQQQDFDDVLGAAGATPGIPIFYTLRGNTGKTTSATILSGGDQRISCWPVMNYIGSFRFGYFRSVASCQLTADTDLPIVPVQYQPALIAKAAAYGLAARGALAQSQSLLAYAEEMLANAIKADELARTGDRAPGERPTIGQALPPNPGLANPANTPYGWGQAA